MKRIRTYSETIESSGTSVLSQANLIGEPPKKKRKLNRPVSIHPSSKHGSVIYNPNNGVLKTVSINNLGTGNRGIEMVGKTIKSNIYEPGSKNHKMITQPKRITKRIQRKGSFSDWLFNSFRGTLSVLKSGDIPGKEYDITGIVGIEYIRSMFKKHVYRELTASKVFKPFGGFNPRSGHMMLYGPDGVGKKTYIFALCKKYGINILLLCLSVHDESMTSKKIAYAYKLALQNQPCVVHIVDTDEYFKIKYANATENQLLSGMLPTSYFVNAIHLINRETVLHSIEKQIRTIRLTKFYVWTVLSTKLNELMIHSSLFKTASSISLVTVPDLSMIDSTPRHIPRAVMGNNNNNHAGVVNVPTKQRREILYHLISKKLDKSIPHIEKWLYKIFGGKNKPIFSSYEYQLVEARDPIKQLLEIIEWCTPREIAVYLDNVWLNRMDMIKGSDLCKLFPQSEELLPTRRDFIACMNQYSPPKHGQMNPKPRITVEDPGIKNMMPYKLGMGTRESQYRKHLASLHADKSQTQFNELLQFGDPSSVKIKTEKI